MLPTGLALVYFATKGGGVPNMNICVELNNPISLNQLQLAKFDMIELHNMLTNMAFAFKIKYGFRLQILGLAQTQTTVGSNIVQHLLLKEEKR